MTRRLRVDVDDRGRGALDRRAYGIAARAAPAYRGGRRSRLRRPASAQDEAAARPNIAHCSTNATRERRAIGDTAGPQAMTRDQGRDMRVSIGQRSGELSRPNAWHLPSAAKSDVALSALLTRRLECRDSRGPLRPSAPRARSLSYSSPESSDGRQDSVNLDTGRRRFLTATTAVVGAVGRAVRGGTVHQVVEPERAGQARRRAGDRRHQQARAEGQRLIVRVARPADLDRQAHARRCSRRCRRSTASCAIPKSENPDQQPAYAQATSRARSSRRSRCWSASARTWAARRR